MAADSCRVYISSSCEVAAKVLDRVVEPTIGVGLSVAQLVRNMIVRSIKNILYIKNYTPRKSLFLRSVAFVVGFNTLF